MYLMPNAIESKGIAVLKEVLTRQGRKVENSDSKTFDLKVDGKYAEVKTKHTPYNKLDFLSFTDKQYDKISKEDFLIFLICNIDDPEQAEIYEFSSKELREIAPKKYTSHEFNKSVIDRIEKTKI